MVIGVRSRALSGLLGFLMVAVDGYMEGFTRTVSGGRSNTPVMGLRERLAKDSRSRDRVPYPPGSCPSGVESLYSSDEVEDKHREFRPRFFVLGTSRPRAAPAKSDKERQLDSLLMGEWALTETSVERPTSTELKDQSFKPRQVSYREQLLFDFGGSVMITNADTAGYGVGWAWERLDDMYNPPTLNFRINRKGVGIEFDEYEHDINRSPSMFFYQGSFVDGEFKRIEGAILRNREILADPHQPRVMVNVGSFQLCKVD